MNFISFPLENEINLYIYICKMPKVLVERFGLAARFGFTHLAATNVAVWIRLVIWDSAQEWTYFVHLAQHEQQTSVSPLNLRGFPGSLTRQSRDLIGAYLTFYKQNIRNILHIHQKRTIRFIYFRRFYDKGERLQTLPTCFERANLAGDRAARMFEH